MRRLASLTCVVDEEPSTLFQNEILVELGADDRVLRPSIHSRLVPAALYFERMAAVAPAGGRAWGRIQTDIEKSFPENEWELLSGMTMQSFAPSNSTARCHLYRPSVS